MSDSILRKSFSDIDLSDGFFDSLKDDYKGFEAWFSKKGAESAYVFEDEGEVHGFMYLKQESGVVDDVTPPLPSAKRLKVGTFKIDAHGTKLGHRFLKKALDHALQQQADQIYLTIFEKHAPLVGLLVEFGFSRHGTKTTSDGTELVLVKELGRLKGNLRKDYPFVSISGRRVFMLGIYPEWHTKLFPDSILSCERYDVVEDVTHTNSIQKAYVCFMDLAAVGAGDLFLIYRTKDGKGPAEYRSVVTSVCTVEDIRGRESFVGVDDFLTYTKPVSVFSESELRSWWRKPGRIYVVKMLYNAAFAKRIVRRDLIERFGIDRNAYAGFMELSREQFRAIISAGGIDARLVVD